MCAGVAMNGQQSSAVICEVTHQGALNRASRNTPPVRRTEPINAESGSIMRANFGRPVICLGPSSIYYAAHAKLLHHRPWPRGNLGFQQPSIDASKSA